MTYVLEGVQFRELKTQLPSWTDAHNYRDWEDCNGRVDYPTGTEFRVKPVMHYVVTDSFDKVILTTTEKTAAMAKVATVVTSDNFAAVRKEVLTSPGIAQYLSNRGVQFKLTGSERWVNPPHFGGVAVGSPIRFRLRPDDYFQVDVKTGIAQSTLEFDDVDELEKYVSRMLRTSNNSIHVTRRPYGITLSL